MGDLGYSLRRIYERMNRKTHGETLQYRTFSLPLAFPVRVSSHHPSAYTFQSRKFQRIRLHRGKIPSIHFVYVASATRRFT